jgi:hypothetical protein
VESRFAGTTSAPKKDLMMYVENKVKELSE